MFAACQHARVSFKPRDRARWLCSLSGNQANPSQLALQVEPVADCRRPKSDSWYLNLVKRQAVGGGLSLSVISLYCHCAAPAASPSAATTTVSRLVKLSTVCPAPVSAACASLSAARPRNCNVCATAYLSPMLSCLCCITCCSGSVRISRQRTHSSNSIRLPSDSVTFRLCRRLTWTH